MNSLRDNADPGLDREMQRALRRLRKHGAPKGEDGHKHPPKAIKRLRRMRRHIDTIIDEKGD
jgi:hypothetical protein